MTGAWRASTSLSHSLLSTASSVDWCDTSSTSPMHSNGGIGRGRAEAPGERQAHRGLTPANEDGRPTASRQIVSPDPDINRPVLSSRGAWSLRPRLAAAHSGHHPEQRRSHRAHHHRDDRRESAETLGGRIDRSAGAVRPIAFLGKAEARVRAIGLAMRHRSTRSAFAP